MRLKRDELIHEMALKQKKQVAAAKQAREPVRVMSPNFCGFIGVQNLVKNEVDALTMKCVLSSLKLFIPLNIFHFKLSKSWGGYIAT